MSKRRIGILTGGGDCAGLNAVIRAVTKKAILEQGYEVFGYEDGYEGVIHNRYRPLAFDDVSGILTLGGTILGTSNKANPFKYAVKADGKVTFEDRSRDAVHNIQDLGLECLVCIGGDGTLTIANKLCEMGVPVVGVPKTIDNDIRGTDITFGFDSAVEIVTEGIDRIHSTAQSHHRVMIIEVMGRTAGWIALHSGVAGGGDIILLPEIPYDINKVAERVLKRGKEGKRFSIIVVAEGAKPIGGEVTVKKIVEDSHEKVRLGGISFRLVSDVEALTGLEARAVVMGHLQRGGTPSSFDRVLATRLGTRVVDMIEAGQFGHMCGVRCDGLVNVPLSEVARGPRLVDPADPLIRSARSIGVIFGD
ncbi:MAG: ATP-dependent 6-phosphofructokinase [Candidatus Omnitrophica bacterium]|nr:ATP-dependent 6-phosphofructokinase [Candidatus Omnitrophota bacterium]MCB9719303.1 ATP-dependent 6-phosphofructokinase [Candidatus Omnitrophota bacterium]